MNIIKPQILNLREYSVPQEDIPVKLNQNEAAYDCPEEIKNEIINTLVAIPWHRYPPGLAAQLIRAVSGYTGWPEAGILAGNGSNELIQTLIAACCSQGDKIVIPSPTFSVYKRTADIMGVSVNEVRAGADFLLDPEDLIRAGRDAEMMIIANPNNPTGTMLSLGNIAWIARNFNGLLVVDEAYWEFCGESALPLIRKMENVVVLRTFSKALRLAGFRLGYALACPDLISQLFKARLPFSVGLMQQIAGLKILKNITSIKAGIEEAVQERGRIFAELKGMDGIRPVPSRANFILFEIQKRSSLKLFSVLRKAGVLVRAFDDPALENMLRVSIGKPEENDRFLESLAAALKGDRP